MSASVVIKTLRHRLGLQPKEMVGDVEVESALQAPVFTASALRLFSTHEEWSIRAAGLALASLHFNNITEDDVIVQALLDNVEHENTRVRLETLGLLALLAKRNPSLAWDVLAARLIEIAQLTIKLDEDTRGIEAERQGLKETKQEEEDFEMCELYRNMVWEIDIRKTKRFSVLARQQESENEGERQSVRSSRLSSSGWSARRRLDSGQIVLLVHETAGWKALETSLRGINELVKQMPERGAVNREIVSLVKQAMAHSNRYARLVGFELLGSLSQADPCLLSQLLPSRDLATWLKRGMCDSVNEVRLRACLACKEYLRHAHDLADLLPFAPALCLNRHYPQVGIREPSIEAWRLAPLLNKHLVLQHLELFCKFFIKQSETARDEFAREASCVAMGEVMSRVLLPISGLALDEIQRRMVADMCGALELRLADSSWSVQAAACQALGEMFDKELVDGGDASNRVVEALLECASDLIWSVREEAAIALSKLKNAPSLLQQCREMMLRHPPHKHEKGHGHEEHSTEDQVMFACCSSEITDKKQLRKREFQYIDGGLRLFHHLYVADAERYAPLLDDFLQLVAREGECRHHHHQHHEVVEETIWAVLPPIASKMGKREFKRKLLDAVLPSLIRALENPCFSAAYRASLACQFLIEFVGEGILRARVEALPSAGRTPGWEIIQRNPPSAFDSPIVSFRV